MTGNGISERLEAIRSFYGREALVSDWFVVTQELINKFGEATCDNDWLHTDPERAHRESPFGTTIAFGFWTLSMLTYFARKVLKSDYPPGALFGLNYGFDRVRLVEPIPVGARIRCRVGLVSVEERGEDRYLVKTDNRIELEGKGRPALTAEWLVLLVYPGEKGDAPT